MFGSQRLFDNLRDAIVVADREGRVVLWNAAALQVFGYTDPAAGEVAFEDLFPRREVRSVFATTFGEAGRAEIHLVQRTLAARRDGTRVEVEVSLCPIEDVGREGIFVLAVVREVEALEEASPAAQAAEVHSLREQLASGRARVLELESAARAEAEVATERTQLANVAAHEIAAPLTAVQLQLDLLRTSIPAPSEAQRRGFDLLDRNISRLLLLSQDLLDAMRLEAGRLKVYPRAMDLAATVRDAAEGLREQAAQAEIAMEVKVPGELPIVGDPNRLAQVVTNLVHNALKFTPRGGRVTVRGRSDGSHAVVEVEDSGIGIRPEDAPRLFMPFSQVAERAVQPGAPRGTGLGLFISKGIVEGHGGAITCASSGPGQGAVFQVRLPLAR